MPPDLQELVEAADLNDLLRAVHGLCAVRAWDDLIDLANMCEDALERGKQLWPIAVHIDYRLALEAPGEYAAGVLHAESPSLSPGPLTEVAASTHKWRELADHIESPLVAAYVAQERVLRGERLEADERAHPEMLDLPLHLFDWEPTYALATYHSDHVEVAEPWSPKDPLRPVERRAARELEESELVDALLDLVLPWTNESNGAARAVVVEGDAVAAASALTMDVLRMGRLTVAEALQRMAWAAAGGGAHGRRRGAALGRFTTLYTGSLLADVAWPRGLAGLGEALSELEFFYFDEGAEEKGWVLRLAVSDPAHGWSAALSATDLLEEIDASSSA